MVAQVRAVIRLAVDGGPNVASVRVLRGAKQVAHIPCHEPSAVDHSYEELSKLGLPSSNAR